MSIATRYMVQCDHEYRPESYCDEECEGENDAGERAVISAAKEAGWLQTTVNAGGTRRHYCPAHRAEHEKVTT